METELIGLVKDVPKVLTTIYVDLAQPGVRKVGTALETVLEFNTSFLLPVKLLNEKFKLNFKKRLNDYKEKLCTIPEEELCEVNPQIGTPIIEKLSYTTNDEIADLFTSLLAKASSKKLVNMVHPSFIQLIERLSVDEARIIKHLLNEDFIPFISFKGRSKKDNISYLYILNKATFLSKEVELLFPKNLNIYLENLIGMGILDLSHMSYKVNLKIYEKLYELHEYDKLNEECKESGVYKELEKENGYFQITNFGKLFIRACSRKK